MARPSLAPELLDRVQPLTLAREQVLPVAPGLVSLLPGGALRRGTTLALGGTGWASGAHSLALALVAEASRVGSWTAFVGMGDLSLAAAAELGVSLERSALIEMPEPASWAAVVGALIGACDLIVTAPPVRLRPGDHSRLFSRLRERGSVLLQVGQRDRHPGMWESADLAFTTGSVCWEGLGVGHGHLRSRRVEVWRGGRRDANRVERCWVGLPGLDGRVGVCDAPAANAEILAFPLGDTALGDTALGNTVPASVAEHRR